MQQGGGVELRFSTLRPAGMVAAATAALPRSGVVHAHLDAMCATHALDRRAARRHDGDAALTTIPISNLVDAKHTRRCWASSSCVLVSEPSWPRWRTT